MLKLVSGIVRKSAAVLALGAACAILSSTARAQDVPAHNPPGLFTVRGSVVSASAATLGVQTMAGLVAVKIVRPFHVYARVPGSMSGVTTTSYVGVTSIKQPDGTERATEIHIFPEALRGMGEGSYMMKPISGGSAGRMTNGKVSASRMTNGKASRMSNGSVKHLGGSSLVVQYAGGVQTVTIPPNTPVTQFQLTATSLKPGEKVFVIAKKSKSGEMTSDEAIVVPR